MAYLITIGKIGGVRNTIVESIIPTSARLVRGGKRNYQRSKLIWVNSNI